MIERLAPDWVALHRFGLGPKPGERGRLARDPKAWVLDQIEAPQAAQISARLPGSADSFQRFMALREEGTRRQEADRQGRRERLAFETQVFRPGTEGKADVPPAPGPEDVGRREIFVPELVARFRHAATTDAAFTERMVLFWVNHFAVSIRKGSQAVAFNGPFEREAIRPHVFGSFGDMLRAVVTHPAMLFYLDNSRSIGPNSQAGRRTGRSLNENLAREVLELHTLGVDGGYSQSDVTTFAQVLTGWTFVPWNQPNGGRFVFRPAMHEPGPKTVLGQHYRQEGEDQGLAVLRALAEHPSTARHIARKLAGHFISDAPPPQLIDHLAEVFLATKGNLAAVCRSLVEAPEAWTAPLQKLRSPLELLIATQRATGLSLDAGQIQNWSAMLGQPVMAPPSPRGFPDDTSTWLASDAIKTRLDWANMIGQRFGRPLDVIAVANDLYGPLLSQPTTLAIRRAESRQQALTLLLMSPEFQRR